MGRPSSPARAAGIAVPAEVSDDLWCVRHQALPPELSWVTLLDLSESIKLAFVAGSYLDVDLSNAGQLRHLNTGQLHHLVLGSRELSEWPLVPPSSLTHLDLSNCSIASDPTGALALPRLEQLLVSVYEGFRIDENARAP
jgi:hypothetical protein